MTRIAAVSDVHVANHAVLPGGYIAGINRRCREVLDTLERACDAAEQMRADVLVIDGDLFDGPRPLPQIVRAVQVVLAGGCEKVVILGNHEQVSDVAGDHALGPLSPVVACVVDAPQVLPCLGTDIFCVPFRRGPICEWLPVVLETLSKQSRQESRVLCMHAGIIHDGTPGFLRGSEGAIPVEDVERLCREFCIHAALSGDWHAAKNFGHVAQVGALCPTGFDNPGFEHYGTMAVWEDSSPNKIRLRRIPGPRFVRVASVSEFDAMLKTVDRKVVVSLYVDFVVPASEMANAIAVKDLAVEDGFITGGRVRADRSVEGVAAKSVKKAQSLVSLDEALVECVAGLGLDPARQPGVVDRARGYLARGGG